MRNIIGIKATNHQEPAALRVYTRLEMRLNHSLRSRIDFILTDEKRFNTKSLSKELSTC